MINIKSYSILYLCSYSVLNIKSYSILYFGYCSVTDIKSNSILYLFTNSDMNIKSNSILYSCKLIVFILVQEDLNNHQCTTILFSQFCLSFLSNVV